MGRFITKTPVASVSTVQSQQRCQMSSGRRSIRTHQISEGRVLAYRQVPGQLKPTIVVVPGLHSYIHMNGMLAKSMLRYCDMHNYSCVVYDHECMGESQHLDGVETSKVLFSHWIEDVTSVIENLTEGRVVIVGASLGGWLALVAAQQVRQRVHGLLLYGPAINYVYPYYQRHMAALPQEIRDRILHGDVHLRTYGTFGDAMLKKDFAEDSRKYEMDLSKPINIDCPVRIVHGLLDSEVDPLQSLQLCKMLRSKEVDLIYRKDGPHQLDSPPDIELFLNTLDRMLKDYPVK